MNELSNYLVKSILEEKAGIENIVVVYPGRFQPFHKGHYATYQHLVKKFGKNNVYIGTSNKTDNKKSPFNFKEKVMVMGTMFGIPKNKIVQVKNPYAPTEILKKFDEDTTLFITVVGKKDASRLGGKYFTPYKDNLDFEGYRDKGYVYVAPEGGGGVSGTEVRRGLKSGSDEDKKKFFTKRAYPKFNQKIFDFIVDKLATLPEISENRIFIPKEIIEDWLVNGGTEFIKETFSQGADGVDDGPNFLFPNYAVYSKISRERAEKIGYEVLDNIMSADLTDIDTHPEYPTGPVKAVTPYAAGVIGRRTSTNQKDFGDSKAYRLWYKHVTRPIALVGYSLVAGIDIEDYDGNDYGDISKSDGSANDVNENSSIDGLSGGNNSARWTAPGKEKKLNFVQLSGYTQEDYPTADELDISGEDFGYVSTSSTAKYHNKRKAKRSETGELIFEKNLKENIKIPVKVGDTILTGRFKNKKTIIKNIGKDEHGMPTINGRKVVNFRIVKEGVQVQLDEIPMADLKKIDQYADKQLNPVDVVLTDKHFFDRLQDPRNKKDISQAELIGFFKRLGKNKKKFVDFLNQFGQIVAKDNRSKINIPFMKRANKAIAKTVMRKDNFMTSSPEYTFEGIDETDFGKTPYVVDLEDLTIDNDNFRTTKWTGDDLQMTLMSIGDEIGLERHENGDQFIRVEEGEGKVVMGLEKDNLDFEKEIKDDVAIFIPEGYWHNIINTGDTPLKVYAIYAPPEHPKGKVDELHMGYPSKEDVEKLEKRLKSLRNQFDKEKKDLNFDKSYAVQEGQIDAGEPETGYIPDGKKRKLGKRSGRPEPWFDQLGYTQVDYPKADRMRGRGKGKDTESSFRKVYYKTKNVKVSKLKQALKPVGSNEWPEVIKEATSKDIVKDLDKVKNDLLKQVAVLVAKKKKLYSNMDIESPMSSAEKKLDKDIADLWSQINKLVRQKRSIKESILTEGGAYGHMNHPFDKDVNLTFGQLKDIVNKALTGELNLTREKTDGQALAISWRDDRGLIAARNKSHLKNSGENALDIKGVATKFKGRGELEKAYNFAMRDLENAVSNLSSKQRKKIFKDGSCFMNLEVIYPTSVNVIPYGASLLVFHGTMEYDEDGNAIGENQAAARTLAGMIKQIEKNVQTTYTIQGPPIIELPKSQNLSSKKPKYNGMINKLQKEFGLKDSDGVAEYHQAWWNNWIEKNAPSKLDETVFTALLKRWAFDDKSFRLNKKNIEDDEVLSWARKTDKMDKQRIEKENINKFEKIFLGLGSDILEFTSSVLTVSPDKATRDIKDRVKKAIKDIKKSGDPSKIRKLKLELERLNQVGGLDKIVPNEGIVFTYNGKTMKLTGSFASVNQLLGLMYY